MGYSKARIRASEAKQDDIIAALTGPITTQTSTGPTIGSTTTLALAANASRIYASFVNDADEDIYLTFGTNAVMNTGIMLEAGRGSYEITRANLFKGQVNAICTSGGKILCVTEGV